MRQYLRSAVTGIPNLTYLLHVRLKSLILWLFKCILMKGRITELDSLRGIAAFTVLVHHCVLAFPIVSTFFNSRDAFGANPIIKFLMFSPLHVLWNGHAAVILFFILSGFVLSISHYTDSKPDYGNYIIKRMCRLYIPYFTIITISVLLLNFYKGDKTTTGLSDWLRGMWETRISPSEYIQLLFFQGNMHNVGTTLWTIIIEIEVSIILPFFFTLIKRMNFVSNLLFIVGFNIAFKILNHLHFTTYIPDFQNMYYVPFFLIGGVMFKYRNEISNTNLSPGLLTLVLAAIFFFYNYEWIMVWLVKYNNKSPLYVFSDYMIGISGILLISICIMDIPGLKKVMNNSVFSFLGKISYSLYLIHPIILLFLVYTFNTLSYNALIFIILAASVLLSWGYYMAVEEPSMKLGKYLAKKLRPNKGKEKLAA